MYEHLYSSFVVVSQNTIFRKVLFLQPALELQIKQVKETKKGKVFLLQCAAGYLILLVGTIYNGMMDGDTNATKTISIM